MILKVCLIFIFITFKYQTLAQVETSSQTLSTGVTSKDKNQDIEKVEVTGSYIKRIDGEGPAPVTVIDQEAFLRTGSIDVADVLKEDPAFEAVYEGSGHVRFRGQHAGNVLIMLNGMRLPKQAGGYYTSISSLPSSVMEKIELLKDGGSSLYGSDAMSGVMNFKTKKNYDGAEVTTGIRTNDDGLGTQQNYVASFGKNFNKGNILGVIQYESSDSYKESDLGSYNNSGDIAQQAGSVVDYGGNYEVGERCGTELCDFNDLSFREPRAADEDISALLTGSLDLTSDIRISVLGMFNKKNELSNSAPNRLGWRDTSGNGGFLNAVDRSEIRDADFEARLNAAGAFRDDKVSVQGIFADEIGATVTDRTVESVNTQLQVEGYLGDTWTWQVLLGAGLLDEESTTISGEADQAVLRELFVTGRMDLANGPVDLSSAYITPTVRSRGEMLTAKTVFAGEVANFSNGGILSAALGAEGQYESIEFDNDLAVTQGRTLGRSVDNVKGSRRVNSAFAEFAYAPISEVELQLSGRIDSYSDVGETVNPRFAFLLRPTNKMIFRGSVGTGFRAPGLTDVNGDSQISSSFIRGEGYAVTERYNKEDLKPEEGTNYAVGTVIEPIKGFSLAIDQWNFEGTNTLTAVRENDYIAYENAFGSAAAREAGALIERDGDGNLVSIRAPRVTNLGQRTLRGVDASINMSSNFNNVLPFTLGFNNGFSYIFERSETRFALEEETSFGDTWKLTNSIFINNDIHFAQIRALTVSSDVTRDDVKLSQFTSLDISYGYTASWGGRINLVVKNFLNDRAPTDTTAETVTFGRPDRNFSAFSPLGRRYFASYSQTF